MKEPGFNLNFTKTDRSASPIGNPRRSVSSNSNIVILDKNYDPTDPIEKTDF